MPPEPLVFQFHDIATIEVTSEASFVRDFFEAEYGYHRADHPQPDPSPRVFLDFELGGSTPRDFVRHSHKFLARWSYRLTIEPARVDIKIHGNKMAVPMAQHMLVHPALRWLSAGAGTLLLHAGAVAKNGKSLIFTGKGGAGKTTTTSLVLASGRSWQLHADDYVFLRPGPHSMAYVTRSHLYRDLLKWVPTVNSRLTGWERIRLQFFGALRRYSAEGIKWPVRLGPQRLWPGKLIAGQAIPAAVLLLERASISAPALITIDDRERAADDLLEMNFGEARHFLSLLAKAGQLDETWLAAWRKRERELLMKILAEIPLYRLVLPLSQSAADAQTVLVPVLEDLVK